MSSSKDLLAVERYAAALFELASSAHEDPETEAELVSFSAALQRSPEIEQFFHNPRLGLEEKKRSLERIYPAVRGTQMLLMRFLTLLLEKNRFYLIHEITECFKRISAEARGESVAEIKSAVPLTPGAEREIVSRLERLAGMKIQVKKEVDPSLVGGVAIKMKQKVLDGSVKNKINLFRKELSRTKSI